MADRTESPAGTGTRAKAGQPSPYDAERHPAEAEKLCNLGLTDAEIADWFEVSVRTIHRWKAAHEEFCHALKAGKDIADERVERSLYQRATGYDYTEQQAFKVKNQTAPGEFEETVEVVDVQRHQPTDTTAAIFWLKNRRKDDWRDKQEHEHTGKGGGPLQYEDVTADADAFTSRFSSLAAARGAGSGAGEADAGDEGSS